MSVIRKFVQWLGKIAAEIGKSQSYGRNSKAEPMDTSTWIVPRETGIQRHWREEAEARRRDRQGKLFTTQKSEINQWP